MLADPHTGAPVVGFVARGDAVKLAYLRADPTITLTVRGGLGLGHG